MDQLKQIFGQLAKHQFWIVTVFAVVLGIAGFFVASSTINDLYTKQKSALDSHFSNLQNVASAVSTHPNDESQKQMDQIIGNMAEDVRDAWQSQWERQEPLLQWPVDDIASPTLVRKLKDYLPIELKLEYPEEPSNIVDSEKFAFALYFDDQMPRLADIIGVTWVGEAKAVAAGGMGEMGGMGMGMGGGRGDMMGGGMEEGMEGGASMGGYGMGMGMGGMGMGGMGGYGQTALSSKRDIVTWPKSSQDELITAIRMWTGENPNVYQIVYTQENMWILEGLLNIIKKTNGDAQANFQTTVKEIEFIRIGRTAVGQAGDITSAARGRGMPTGMEGYGQEMGGEELESGSASASMTSDDMSEEKSSAAASPDPANGRYVDAAFKPITGEDLRTRMRSEDPSDAYFAVAKRVPVRLRLKIDQRKTHDFLANCGNADLMLEVRQVRLGNTKAAVAGGGGSFGGGGGGMYGGGMMEGMMGGRSGMMGGGMESGGMDGGKEGGGMEGYGGGMMGGGMMGMGGQRAITDPWEIPIEVYGVVYLFNPVNINRLGLDKVTEETEMDVTVDTPADIDAPETVATTNEAENGANVDPGAAQNGETANGAAGNGAAGDGATGNNPGENGASAPNLDPAPSN